MIIRFNENLEVEEIDAEESINAGNNLVNEIKVFMPSDFDFNSHKGYANFRLSDGKEYNNLIMERTKKPNLQLEEEKCYYYTLPKYLTKQKGPLLLTVRISPIDNMKVIANSGVITTNVNYAIFENGEEVVDPDIAEQLRQEIAEGEIRINEALEKSEEALAKANDALYHDATIVKVNGEVQQTWDATYAQKITEESANKVNVTNYNTGSLSAYAWVIKGSLKLEANKTYTISFYTTSSISANQVYLNENYFKKNTSIVGDYYFTDSYAQNTLATKTITTITDITIEKDTLLKCTTAREYPIRNFMINEGTEALPYSPYNQKRHITNPQADLLKSEWEKSVNLFNYKNIGSGFLDPNSGNIYKNSGWVYGKHYSKVDSNTTYTLSWVGGTFYQANICFYDNSKTFISGVKLEKNKTTKMSFTTPNNTSYITVGYTINNGVDGDIEKTNVMLNEGPEALPYQEWNGSIIHEKDIDPVLLWENGNPNNEFVGKEYDTFNRTPYKRFLLGYYITPGSAIKFIEINNASNSGGALTDLWAYENGATIYNLIRKFSLTSSNQTKITFGDCYQGTSVVNTRMIPAILYGLYY